MANNQNSATPYMGRNSREIRADQSRAMLDDANESTRPNTVTVAELQANRPAPRQ